MLARQKASIVSIPLLDDELLSSYWRRVLNINAWASRRVHSRSVMNQPWRELRAGIPTHLNTFYTAIGQNICTDVDSLVLRHTLYGAYAAALSTERQYELRNRMLVDSVGPRLPCLPLSGIDRLPSIMMTCSACDLLSVEKYGTTTWRRVHNVPGVSVCLLHQIPLIRFSLISSEAHPTPKSHEFTDSRMNSDVRLAQAYHSILNMGTSDLVTFRDSLRRRASALVGACSTRRDLLVAAHEVTREFRSGFVSKALSQRTCDPLAVSTALGGMFRRRSAIHPLWAALCHAALPQEQVSNRVVRETSKVHHVSSDVVQILRKSPTLSSTSAAVGLSISTLSILAKEHSLRFSFRPSLMTDDLRTQTLMELQSGASVKEVAAVLGASAGSIYRVLAASKETQVARETIAKGNRLREKRKSWCETMGDNQGMSRTQLRQTSPAMWAWLYRNDREWLTSSTASRAAVVRQVAACTVRMDCEQIKAHRLELLTAKTHALRELMNRRVTATFLLKAIGICASKRKDTGGLHTQASNLAESPKQFVLRRLTAACARLESSRRPVVRWAVIHEACVRPETVVRVGIDIERWIARRQTGLPNESS